MRYDRKKRIIAAGKPCCSFTARRNSWFREGKNCTMSKAITLVLSLRAPPCTHQVSQVGTKALTSVMAMGMLGNSVHGLQAKERRVLYRACVLPIATYGHRLWYYNGAPVKVVMKILGTMQRKAAIWITGAFRTSPTGGVQAIAGLLPIHLHIRKLSWRASFRTATLSATHPARSLMGAEYRGDAEEHPLAISQLTPKQLAAVCGSIVDANDALPPLADVFEPCAQENRPGQRLLDLFPDRVAFFHRKDFPKADTPPPSPTSSRCTHT